MTRPIKKSKRKSVGWERISVYKVFLLERVRMRVMLGVPAILLVHPIFFKNAKSVLHTQVDPYESYESS